MTYHLHWGRFHVNYAVLSKRFRLYPGGSCYYIFLHLSKSSTSSYHFEYVSSVCVLSVILFYIPFGLRILFLLRLPPTLRFRLIGLGDFLRLKYLASTPNRATLANTETITT